MWEHVCSLCCFAPTALSKRQQDHAYIGAEDSAYNLHRAAVKSQQTQGADAGSGPRACAAHGRAARTSRRVRARVARARVWTSGTCTRAHAGAIDLEDEVDMAELISLAMEILKERDRPLKVRQGCYACRGWRRGDRDAGRPV